MNRIVVCMLFFVVSVSSSAQINDHYFSDQLKRFFNLYPQEKAFLAVDNTTYIKGERIWYKAYLWNATNEQLSDDVRVLLRDAHGQILAEQRVLMADGEGQGDFEIPEKIQNDVYVIELYSNWMQNFSNKPIAKRWVSISDGNPVVENQALATQSRRIVTEGDFNPGKYSRFSVFTGFLVQRKFQLEVSCNDDVVFTKQYESPLVSDSVLIQKVGEYKIKVCMEDGNDCFTLDRGKIVPELSFVQPKKLNVSQAGDDCMVAVCTANSLLEAISIEGKTTLSLNLSNYPPGLLYFLLIDKNAKRVVSATSAYRRAEEPATNTKVTLQGDATTHFPLITIEIEERSEKIHAMIRVNEATTGLQMLGDVGSAELSGGLRLHAFALTEKINEFLEKGSLPIARKSRSFSLRIEKPSLDALDFLLSEIGNRNKIDSVARYKKIIDGIQSDYSPDHTSSYSRLPADDRYVPTDYPTIYEPIEFLRQAIPRLKAEKVGNTENFHFLYTNLKGQKQLYESPAALIINGYKVPSFAFLGSFEKDDIISISALYNSETLVSSKLNTLLPGGAIEVKLKPSARAVEKLTSMPLFSIPFNWTHDLQPPGEILGSLGPRFPMFATLYHWSEPYENAKRVSLNLPRKRIQSTSMTVFSMDAVKGETYRKISLDIN